MTNSYDDPASELQLSMKTTQNSLALSGLGFEERARAGVRGKTHLIGKIIEE